MSISEYINKVLAQTKDETVEFDIGVGVAEAINKPYLYVSPDSGNRIKFTISPTRGNDLVAPDKEPK